jgi:hypothetical protein
MTRYATIIPPVKRIEVELVHLLKEFKLAEKPDSSHLSPTRHDQSFATILDYLNSVCRRVDGASSMVSSARLRRTVVVFIEIATMLTNRKRRSLHDFIAGSVVVKLYNQPMERAA